MLYLGTLKTIEQALSKPGTPDLQNHVPHTLETMHFHQKLDNKVQ